MIEDRAARRFRLIHRSLWGTAALGFAATAAAISLGYEIGAAVQCAGLLSASAFALWRLVQD